MGSVPDVSQPFEASFLPQSEVPFEWFQLKELSRDFELPDPLALNDDEGPLGGLDDMLESARRGRLALSQALEPGWTKAHLSGSCEPEVEFPLSS